MADLAKPRVWVVTIHSVAGSFPVEYVEDSPGSDTWHLVHPEQWQKSPPIDPAVLALTAPVRVRIEGPIVPAGETPLTLADKLGMDAPKNEPTGLPGPVKPNS